MNTISVVIPAYQAERFISEALESVAAQTVEIEQIVVVDDGSTDATAQVAERWSQTARIQTTVIRQTNSGAGAARRAGLLLTDAEMICFLDADDRLVPHALADLRTALEAAPVALIASGAMRPFVDIPAGGETRSLGVVSSEPALLSSASLIRRSAFSEIGHFEDGNFSFASWVARIVERGAAAATTINLVVAERRLHGANTSLTDRNREEHYHRIIRESLRRRASQGEGSR
jgi:glycosyltransferase involved in cell wall biosynthesis